jgi:hypothetical protein
MQQWRAKFEECGFSQLPGNLRLHFILPRAVSALPRCVIAGNDVIINIDLPFFLLLFQRILSEELYGRFKEMMCLATSSPVVHPTPKRSRSSSGGVQFPEAQKCHRKTSKGKPCGLRAATCHFHHMGRPVCSRCPQHPR